MSDFVIKNGVLKKYNGNGGNVEIPEGVTEISKNAFKNREDISSIRIPESVAIISDDAFMGCYGLADENGYVIVKGTLYDCKVCHTDIIIPDGVKRVFYYPDVTGITSIRIPNSVEEVDFDVFGKEWENLHSRNENSYGIYSWNFKKLDLPDSLVEKWGLTGLKKRFDIEMLCISMLNEPDNYSSVLRNVLLRYITKRKDSIIKFLIKKDNVKSLENLCKFINLKPFEIKEYYRWTKEIFTDVENVEHFLRSIGGSSEAGSEISVAEWRKIFKFTIKNEEVVISKYLGKETEVVIPEMIGKNKVVAIGNYAFESEPMVRTVRIPETVREIGCHSFEKSAIEEIIIPDSINRIQQSTFYDCRKLSLVVLPSNLQEIGDNAFGRCENLDKIELPKGLEIIDCRAFAACRKLREIIIPETVKMIGAFAFDNCINLERIVLNNKEIDVMRHAFYGCKGIESMYDENGFLIINNVLLDYNGTCTEVVIPEEVKIMRASCLEGKNVNKIIVPKSVEIIESWAIMNCPMLEEILILGNKMDIEIQEDAFEDDDIVYATKE